MAKKKENKAILYFALAIGGAFLIHKFFMKSSSDKTYTPGFPEGKPNGELTRNVPTPETEDNNSIMKVFNNPDQIDNSKNYYSGQNTYQNYYGQLNGTTKKVPTQC